MIVICNDAIIHANAVSKIEVSRRCQSNDMVRTDLSASTINRRDQWPFCSTRS